MKLQEHAVEILLKSRDVIPYVKYVVEAADSDRDALGWFPSKVYQEAATSGKLIVVIVRIGNQANYAGHLLFGTTFPRGHVLQIHVSSNYRRVGMAKA